MQRDQICIQNYNSNYMGVFFSIDHRCNEKSSTEVTETLGNTPSSQLDGTSSVRSKIIMCFTFQEETMSFIPLSFIEFVEKRPISFSSTPIVIVEPTQNVSFLNRSPRKPKHLQTLDEGTSSNSDTLPIKEFIPNIPQKYCYIDINCELHQNFEISQYKVNTLHIWIIKPNTLGEKAIAKVFECCRSFNFSSFVPTQYVRVENIFSDIKTTDFTTFASALRPKVPIANQKSMKRKERDFDLKLTNFSKTTPTRLPTLIHNDLTDDNEEEEEDQFLESSTESPISADRRKKSPFGDPNLSDLSILSSSSSPEDESSRPFSPLKLSLVTPPTQRFCFSSRRPCEITTTFDHQTEPEIDLLACSSEDAKYKLKYRNTNECDMVIPGLFIGGEKASRDKKLLKQLKITHIVNLNFSQADCKGYDEDEDDNDENEDSTNVSPRQYKQPQTPTTVKSFRGSVLSADDEENNSSASFSDNIPLIVDVDNEDSSEISSSQQLNRNTSIARFNVKIEDSVFQDLTDSFWQALKFVENANKTGGNVLVHCRRGISRSAALCVAYLMDDRDMSYDDAVSLLKRQRPSVNINQGFEDQLRTFAKTRLKK